MQLERFKNRALALGIGLCLVVGFAAVSGCDPIPRRQLSSAEKVADMEWIYSIFGQNYAPLKYKEKLFGFEFEKLKDEYREKAKATANNDEFYQLMFSFVAQFKDAHTSGSLDAPDIAGRAQVAYLGFSGRRKGKNFVVTDLFPTTKSYSAFPIKVGTEIVKIDGMTLEDAVKSELVKYRDLGQDDTNFTYHVNRLFTRVSMSTPLPKKDTVTLTLAGRKASQQDVVLPWVVKDLSLFRKEQAEARGSGWKVDDKTSPPPGTTFWTFDSPEGNQKIQLNLLNFQGMPADPQRLLAKVKRGTQGFDVRDTFQFLDDVAGWVSAEPKAPLQGATTADTASFMAQYREVPSTAMFLPTAKILPSYFYKAGKELVGYIWVYSFSLPSSAATEFAQTLNTFKTFGVKRIIIDTINNGGGSLVLGMKMAQVLSAKKVAMPDMQLKLSDSWMDEFDNWSKWGSSDAEKELARRVLDRLQKEKEEGKWISSNFSSEFLVPYDMKANDAMEGTEFETVLLVNEMCASMCDIFAGIVQDNKLAKIVGSRTMGAGGNVVDYNQAPNSHFDVRQTESLIVRTNGKYIENVGVTPDVVMDVSESASGKYSAVRLKAEEALFGPEIKKVHAEEKKKKAKCKDKGPNCNPDLIEDEDDKE